MKRREFILLLGCAAAAWPVAARAQQSTMALVGLLSGALVYDYQLRALRQGLKEAGYIEGRNIAIKYVSADGRFERLPALAAELVADPSAVIVAIRLHDAPSTYVANIYQTLRNRRTFLCFHRPITAGTPNDRRVIHAILHSPGPRSRCISPKMNLLSEFLSWHTGLSNFWGPFRAFA
jgi:hypothetical protein